MLNQVYATKLSSSQAFVEGKRIPLTILKVTPHLIKGHKTTEKDGYTSVVLGFGKKTREVRTSEVFEPNSNVELDSLLVSGSIINVTSTSKGKGFAGVMKRHGFSGGPRTHGQSDRGRAPGSIGRGTTPGRVLPGKKMAGRMGNQNVQIRNLKIHNYNSDTGELQITGLIPGGRGTLATIEITKQEVKQ